MDYRQTAIEQVSNASIMKYFKYVSQNSKSIFDTI